MPGRLDPGSSGFSSFLDPYHTPCEELGNSDFQVLRKNRCTYYGTTT